MNSKTVACGRRAGVMYVSCAVLPRRSMYCWGPNATPTRRPGDSSLLKLLNWIVRCGIMDWIVGTSSPAYRRRRLGTSSRTSSSYCSARAAKARRLASDIVVPEGFWKSLMTYVISGWCSWMSSSQEVRSMPSSCMGTPMTVAPARRRTLMTRSYEGCSTRTVVPAVMRERATKSTICRAPWLSRTWSGWSPWPAAMNSRSGPNPLKEPYCKICELYLVRADAAHSPRASTGNASVAGTPLVNAIMLRASWMCLICSLYFLQDHEDCRDEQYCVDELGEAFTADAVMRDVSQQGAERKERQRRQDKPPWLAGQLVAHDNICDDEHVECRPDGDQRGAERSFVLQLLSRVDNDRWTTRGERPLHGASDEQQGVEKPGRPWSRRTSAWPELRDLSLIHISEPTRLGM